MIVAEGTPARLLRGDGAVTMEETAFTLFDTAIGRLGAAWGERGLLAVNLPEKSESQLRARMRRRDPTIRESRPPADVGAGLAAITALLDGEAVDLSAIALDMTGVPPVHRRIYQATRGIPAGQTLSYGEVADRVDPPVAARTVGFALGRNPFAIVVPCHRVLAAGGRLGGFSASGGVSTKVRLLAIERRHAPGTRALFEEPDFDFDPAGAIAHLCAVDAKLARLIDTVGPFRMERKRATGIFAALVEAIVHQQLTGRAAATIHARVCGLFPNPHEGPTDLQLLRVSEGRLRSAGLSRGKILSLKDLARRSAAGDIPTLAAARHTNDAALVECLTAVRGIGRWTVEMLLMFHLGRPDVLPVDDYGIRKGYAVAFGQRTLPSPRELEQHGERWRPYRSVASWYLWRALDLPGQLAQAPQ